MKTNSISAGLAVHARTIATTLHLIFRRACLWTGFLAFATIAFGPQPAEAAVSEAWVQRYGSEAGSPWTADSATALAVDGSGNVFVTGSSGGSESYYDYATIAYSGAGVPLWTNRYSGPGHSPDQATAVAVDASGNVFVTGSSYGGGDYADYATIAYSGAGVPLWTNRYDGPANHDDQSIAVAVDGSGNVFVTGSSVGSGSCYDYATIAYSGAGVALWTNRYDGPANSCDRAHALAVDGNGNVFVTGSSSGSGFIYDYATIAYSGAGVPLWTNRYDGPANGEDQARAVAVDTNGNVFVTGFSAGGFNNPDYATIAYSGAGVPLWTNRYDGPDNGFDLAGAVAVDASGNVFVTGSSATIAYSGAGAPLWTNGGSGIAIAVDGSGNVVVTGGFGDYYTANYAAADGALLWEKSYNGPGNGDDWPQTKSSLAIGSDGAVYVTGTSDGLFLSDFATVKYVWRTEIAIQLLSAIPPKVNLTLSAAPNSSWAIERALELTGPWTNLSALLIGTNGSSQFQDTNPPYPAGFYRARQ